MKRILTAAILLPPVIYLIFRAHPAAVAAAAAAVALLCFHEYRGLVRHYGISTAGPLGYAAGLLVLLVPSHGVLVVTLLLLALLALSLHNDDLAAVLPRAAILGFGVIYIFGPWRCAIALREMSPHWLFFALVLGWIGDTAAYYVGRAAGRHKLAPKLSPSKTWEGSVASVAASLAFGVAYLTRFVPGITVAETVALTLVANLAGQLGDLSESAIKRGAGVKDSGTWLPGHGGWLDRLDSNLFSLPVVYFWLQWIQQP